MEKTFIIAEIGINHNGSLDVAKEMVLSAKRAGAKLIKHQTHVCSDEMSGAAKKVIQGNADISIYDIMDQAALSEEEELELKPEYEPGFTVEREDDGAFAVYGGTVQWILDTTDPNDDASMRRFQQLLIKEGIIAALREKGAVDGSSVRLGEWEFDFTD